MRKVKLSKTKANKFNESGQLIAFYLLSSVWAAVIFKEVRLSHNIFLPPKSYLYLPTILGRLFSTTVLLLEWLPAHWPHLSDQVLLHHSSKHADFARSSVLLILISVFLRCLIGCMLSPNSISRK